MEILLVLLGLLFVTILLWLNILATIAVKYDHTLNSFQKTAQTVVVWLVPIFGATLILHFVFDHSPGAIPKSWIPWPFKQAIFGKTPAPNKNRGKDATGGYPYSSSSSVDHHSDGGGDAGGGE